MPPRAPVVYRMEVTMPAKKLREFLNSQNVPYMTIAHAVAYTATETAPLTHISNKELAKTVIVKVDGTMAMAVLPASYNVDLSAVRAAHRREKCDPRQRIRIQRPISGM